MEDTVHVSVESGDPHDRSTEEDYFRQIIGPPQCFQSAGDQVLHLPVEDSVFFTLSLEELQGVCLL
jgi:hypothetical protein